VYVCAGISKGKRTALGFTEMNKDIREQSVAQHCCRDTHAHM